MFNEIDSIFDLLETTASIFQPQSLKLKLKSFSQCESTWKLLKTEIRNTTVILCYPTL